LLEIFIKFLFVVVEGINSVGISLVCPSTHKLHFHIRIRRSVPPETKRLPSFENVMDVMLA